MKLFIDTIKANKEIGRLNESITELTKDRDTQVAALKEFETKNAEFIASAQTYETMKTEHAKALETMKAEHEVKLSEKDKELATIKESLTKQVEQVKAEAEQTISTVKDSVAAETIAIIASQGTNAAIETVIPKELQAKSERESKVKFTVISHAGKK